MKNEYNVYNEAYIADNINSIPMEKLGKISGQSSCACKINDGNTYGTGFFCRIPYPDKENLLPVLITCNHVFNPKSKKEINFTVNEKKYKL